MKKKLLNFLFLVFACFGYTQKPNIYLTPESKYERMLGNIYEIDNGNFLKLSYEVNASIAVFGIGGEVKLTPYLTICDAKFNDIKTAKLLADEEGYHIVGLKRLQENFYYITSKFNKEDKSTEYFAQKINVKSLEKEGSVINLGAFEYVNKGLFFSYKSESNVTFKYSSDSSKIALIASKPYNKKENEKYYIAVYDKSFKKKWEKTVEMPYLDKYVKQLDAFVTNEGDAGVIIKHYDKDVVKEAIKENGVKVPAYSIKLIIYPHTGGAEKEILINTDNKFLNTIRLKSDNNNSLAFFGLYTSKDGGKITGYFISSLDLANYNTKLQKMDQFPESLIDLVDKDGQASNGKSDPGLDEYFNIIGSNYRNDGSIDILLEYFKVTEYKAERYTSYTYTYGDIIVINTTKNNQVTYTRIPRNQDLSATHVMAAGTDYINYKNKLCVFFNDDKDNIDRDLSKKPDKCTNMKKSVLAMVVVDEKGEFSRQVLIDNRENDSKICMDQCQKLGDGKFFLYAKRLGVFAKSRDVYGLLTLQ